MAVLTQEQRDFLLDGYLDAAELQRFEELIQERLDAEEAMKAASRQHEKLRTRESFTEREDAGRRYLHSVEKQALFETAFNLPN